MKTLALMISTGAVYVMIGNMVSQYVNETPLDGDTSFAYFIIGLVVGVFASRRFGWID